MPVSEINAARKARGECMECANPSLPGGAYCYSCLQRVNARTRKFYRKHRVEKAVAEKDRRIFRKANGLCERCGRPMDPYELEMGYVTCPCGNDKHLQIRKNHPY